MAQDNEGDVRRASIDPHRLLPGETPDNPQPGDAEHWVTVYSQLLEIKRGLIATLRGVMESQTDTVRDELERADIKMLEMQVNRFEERLSVWRAKLPS